MNLHVKAMKAIVVSSCLLLLGLLAGGCGTLDGGGSAPASQAAEVSDGGGTQGGTNDANPSIDLIQVGDRLIVNFADIPNPPTGMEQRVREDGAIMLGLFG